MDALISTDLELYKIFYVTAKCGNITAAAEKLYLTQPSVTKYIQKLEEHLGCKLFLRSKRGVKLSSEGEMLMTRIEPAWQLIVSGERELGALQSMEVGTICIASTEMSFKSYVLPVMESFTERYPGVKIKFSNALNERMIGLLESGSIDIAILHEPFSVRDFMDIRVIEEMDEYAVCGDKFAELTRGKNSPALLSEYPFISMPEGSSTKEYLSRYFADHGLEFKPDIELTTVELMIQAIERGLGIGILPKQMAERLIEQGRIHRIPVEQAFPKRKACLIVNSKLPPSIATRTFIAELLENNK